VDLDLAASYHGAEAVRRVFLADGDALILRTARLLEILADLKARFPNFERASTYASPQALLKKSTAEIAELKDAGLPLYYAGPETGHPEVMRRILKGVTPDQFEDGARRVVEAGARLSVIFLLGVGGVELSAAHAAASAAWCNRVQPAYVSTLTLVPVPGTPIHADLEAGRFRLPGPRGILSELRAFVAGLALHGAVFRSNHASNALPVGGTLPRDKARLLAVLDAVIADQSFSLRPPPSPHSL
jgi:radical SAM superfamily enzyme YgiQ (UPF0313 family)